LAALLLAQDGSATRLCEEVAAGPVGLTVHMQREVSAADAPPLVRAQLPGEVFIERLVSLHAHGQIMMDNLSWLAPAALPPDIQAELAQGRTPIGHLLARMWIRRRTLAAPESLWPALWAHVGLPDPEATRSYAIDVPERGTAMVITECFRRGMLAASPPEY
jgi:chorismate-pyruvate lyase